MALYPLKAAFKGEIEEHRKRGAGVLGIGVGGVG